MAVTYRILFAAVERTARKVYAEGPIDYEVATEVRLEHALREVFSKWLNTEVFDFHGDAVMFNRDLEDSDTNEIIQTYLRQIVRSRALDATVHAVISKLMREETADKRRLREFRVRVQVALRAYLRGEDATIVANDLLLIDDITFDEIILDLARAASPKVTT